MLNISPQSGSLELSVTLGDASFSASGDTDIVLQTFGDFKAWVETNGSPAPPRKQRKRADVVDHTGDDASGDDDGQSDDGDSGSKKSTTNLPLKPYLDRLTLSGNKQKATAIIAWSGESGGKAALTVAEVEALWKKTPFRAPSNLARDLRAAAAEGWLDHHGKNNSPGATYLINGYGEGIVAGWVQEK